VGLEAEASHFSLSELQGVSGTLGLALAVERDRFFKPAPVSRIGA
jgi:hypothetical protein